MKYEVFIKVGECNNEEELCQFYETNEDVELFVKMNPEQGDY